MKVESSESPVRGRLFWLAWSGLEKSIHLIHGLFAGFWLGVLDRETLHWVDSKYYDQESMYSDRAYNRRGLFPWEQTAIEKYFSTCQNILLLGAGGGREVLAFEELGFQVTAFECNPRLVACANSLLEEEGYRARVEWLPRDECPPEGLPFDGVVIGWGAYMLIHGSSRRIQILRCMRSRLQASAPVLLSFYTRSSLTLRNRLVYILGDGLRRLRRSERLDPGDDLVPNFVHYFSEDEIRTELLMAGFSMAFYTDHGYGHAVGIAC